LEYEYNTGGFVSEDNETVMTNPLYVPPECFPPLEMHLSEKYSASLASDTDGLANS
jgi:hypothetical protein